MPVNEAVIANQAKIATATATVAERRCLVGRKLIMSANGLGQAKAKLDPIFMSLERSAALSSPLICCLFDIDRSPVYAEPMPREPLPPVGQLIDQNFAEVVRQATLLNPAVHDGAIMASIDRSFSCRITDGPTDCFPRRPHPMYLQTEDQLLIAASQCPWLMEWSPSIWSHDHWRCGSRKD